MESDSETRKPTQWARNGKNARRDSTGLIDRLPAWLAETFIINHANAASWRAQKDRLLAVDSLRSVVASLQDSVIRLQAANAAAYATGYDAAYASHQDLSRRSGNPASGCRPSSASWAPRAWGWSWGG